MIIFKKCNLFKVSLFSSVQLLSHVLLFATPLIAACQASLSTTSSQGSLRLMSTESVMPSSHLILCRPLLLLPSIPPSITIFSNESTLCMRCQRTGVSASASYLQYTSVHRVYFTIPSIVNLVMQLAFVKKYLWTLCE